ncbi:GNAT family N-acetyltransferase [Streptomyces sp. SID5785]|uniref:GNAT family N-acetyltransferase n=1 Tax=Streptomyces sp. SID5785 TaxID=2690309 RepID=UPI0013612197|nr:GNAT family N-acetyltransferase [Streptomyces sp. SID5785]MZD10265.1 GNAT family N-acetyltransferase [Streptomyces sp. SID5785]
MDAETGEADAGGWWLTRDSAQFVARAGDFLRADPALHTVALGVIEMLRAPGAPDRDASFGVWTGPDGRVDGYFFRTAPQPHYAVLPGPAAAAALLDVLGGRLPGGVSGPAGTTGDLAAAWQERNPGGRAERIMAQRLYRLDALTPPDPAPSGRPRRAGPGDRELLVDWFVRFAEDTRLEAGGVSREQAEQWVDGRLGYGGVLLWEAEDGTPLAMAGVTRPAAGSVRVAPVYTPPTLRGRGYGGAVTAEISRAAREAGTPEVLLFTDLANPTSNGLYQRLGYRPLRDFAVWGLTPRAEDVP